MSPTNNKTEKPDVAPVRMKKPDKGRPTKLTPELTEKIRQVISSGSPIDVAARYVGIDRVTFYAWLKRGHEQKRGIFRDFLNTLEEAQAAADVWDHANIKAQSKKDARLSISHLKMRNPDRYESKQKHEHSGPDGKPIPVHNTSEAALLSLFTKLMGGKVEEKELDGDTGEGEADEGKAP